MKIPAAFNLYGQTVQVVFDAEATRQQNADALAVFNENKIIIRPAGPDHPRTDEQIEQAFFHELVHMVFSEMNEERLRDNEKLVDQFAHLLHQALKTGGVV